MMSLRHVCTKLSSYVLVVIAQSLLPQHKHPHAHKTGRRDVKHLVGAGGEAGCEIMLLL